MESDRYVGILGLVVILGICWALSTNRRQIDWRLVFTGMGLQFVLAVLMLKTQAGRAAFDYLNEAFLKLMQCCDAGARFAFGAAADNFAAKVITSMIVVSALMTILYHLGIMQRVVQVMAWVMQRTLRTGGGETLAAAANVFLGQTEAPLLIKPYLARLSNSEILAVMIGGLANISGGVLAVYVSLLSPRFPDIAGHLMAASLMSAPASLVIAKMLMPQQRDVPDELASLRLESEQVDANLIDAAARGALEGGQQGLTVLFVVLAFIPIVAVLNGLWGWGCSGVSHISGWDLSYVDSFQKMLGYVFTPFAWLMGVPSQDCLVAGSLLGEKTVFNEFVAYTHFADYLEGKQVLAGVSMHVLHPRTTLVLAYALCGFANFGSIGILVGGIGAMAPSRHADLARLGLRALIGGTLATFMTATIAALLR